MGMTIIQPLQLPTELHSMQAWHRGLASACAAICDVSLPAKLAAALCQLTPIESILIILERKGLSPQLLYQQGVSAQYQEAVIHRYFSRGYLLDPFCLAVENGLAQGFYHLSEIAPDDFFNSEYYKTYYLKAGSVEDSYYIVDINAQSKISVCVYQGLSSTRFSAEQLNLLRLVEPMVRELLRQFANSPALANLSNESSDPAQPSHLPANLHSQIQAAFMSFGAQWLTEREREVAHFVLRGHSVKSTAQELHISPETVRMHRKNLYSKLDISSQAELFALFIDWLTAA
jgi:DNA-binding CsgD family transcriptional regulator